MEESKASFRQLVQDWQTMAGEFIRTARKI
jgi:hypothetical protein